MNDKTIKIFKLIAFLIAFSGLIMTFIGHRIDFPQNSLPRSIALFFSFFTIWTNILLAVYFFITCFLPDSKLGVWSNKDFVKTALLLYIIFVGAGFHFLLSMVEFKGIRLWGSNILHYMNPILMLIDWLLSKPTTKIKFKHTVLWLLFGIAYDIFALIKGSLTGFYPYPFFDVGDLGIIRVLINILGFSCGFLILGNLLATISNYRLKIAK